MFGFTIYGNEEFKFLKTLKVLKGTVYMCYRTMPTESINRTSWFTIEVQQTTFVEHSSSRK